MTKSNEYSSRLDAERVTLQFAVKSDKRLDAGKRPIEESPLFGGPAQSEMFDPTDRSTEGK